MNISRILESDEATLVIKKVNNRDNPCQYCSYYDTNDKIVLGCNIDEIGSIIGIKLNSDDYHPSDFCSIINKNNMGSRGIDISEVMVKILAGGLSIYKSKYLYKIYKPKKIDKWHSYSEWLNEENPYE